MTEPIIAAAEQAAVTALAPEAEQLLRELESVAAGELSRLETAIPTLAAKAEGASAHAVNEAHVHLAALLEHLHSVLGPAPTASGVGPTPAPEAPTPSSPTSPASATS